MVGKKKRENLEEQDVELGMIMMNTKSLLKIVSVNNYLLG
jgi:hypothetical protein